MLRRFLRPTTTARMMSSGVSNIRLFSTSTPTSSSHSNQPPSEATPAPPSAAPIEAEPVVVPAVKQPQQQPGGSLVPPPVPPSIPAIPVNDPSHVTYTPEQAEQIRYILTRAKLSEAKVDILESRLAESEVNGKKVSVRNWVIWGVAILSCIEAVYLNWSQNAKHEVDNALEALKQRDAKDRDSLINLCSSVTSLLESASPLPEEAKAKAIEMLREKEKEMRLRKIDEAALAAAAAKR